MTLEVRTGSGTGIELLVAAAAMADPDWRRVFTHGSAAYAEVRRHDPGLIAQARRLGRFGWLNLAGPLAETRSAWSRTRLVGLVSRMPPAELRWTLVGGRRRQLRSRVSEAVVREALAGDRPSLRALRAAVDDSLIEVTPWLLRSSDDEVRATCLAVLEGLPDLDAEFVDVGAGPVGVAAGDGAVWVVSAGDETVSRIPLEAHQPDLVVDVPGVPLRVTVAYGAVWVTAFEGKRLVRIDERTGEVTDRIRTGAGPEGVTAGFGSIWVVAQDAGQLLRIDPAIRQITDRFEIGVGARLVTTGAGAVWVSHFADNTVLRVDPGSGEVTASARVCSGPQGLAVTAGQVWTACTFSDQVVGLDPASLEVTSDVPVSGYPDPLTVSPDGTLLVVPEQGPAVVSIDPASGEVVDERVLGELAPLGDRANLDATVLDG